MKIFVIHTKANLCANNSDNKMWIVADNTETAKIIAKQHTRQPSWVLKNLMPKMKSSLQLNGSNLNIS